MYAIRSYYASEIKISVAIDEKYLELAVRALHDAFGLAQGGDVAGMNNN